MVLKANSITATESTTGNHGKTEPKAFEVSWIPALDDAVGSYTPVMMITRAVMVQTTTVSINGSSRATTPSLIGSLVFAAE